MIKYLYLSILALATQLTYVASYICYLAGDCNMPELSKYNVGIRDDSYTGYYMMRIALLNEMILLVVIVVVIIIKRSKSKTSDTLDSYN